jgi:hypothetical protein
MFFVWFSRRLGGSIIDSDFLGVLGGSMFILVSSASWRLSDVFCR